MPWGAVEESVCQWCPCRDNKLISCAKLLSRTSRAVDSAAKLLTKTRRDGSQRISQKLVDFPIVADKISSMCVATKSNEFLCELSCRRFDNSSRRLERSKGSGVFSKDERVGGPFLI